MMTIYIVTSEASEKKIYKFISIIKIIIILAHVVLIAFYQTFVIHPVSIVEIVGHKASHKREPINSSNIFIFGNKL